MKNSPLDAQRILLPCVASCRNGITRTGSARPRAKGHGRSDPRTKNEGVIPKLD